MRTPFLRTLLILGRTSNLPTVWSNCLAGWWLGGQGNLSKLPGLFVGTTLLYLGGMFLNDAFDARFDAQYRRERPIPSGQISVATVWQFGFGLLAIGLILLFFTVGLSTGLLGILLVLCILLYDAIHKVFLLSPILMAACRFFLYVIAASAARYGVTGWSVWCGIALALYVMGLTFVARKEVSRNEPPWWPCLLLAAPIVLAYIMNSGSYRTSAILLSLVVVLWSVRSLRYAYRATERNIGRSISGLLAGIVLVDLLNVADIPHSRAWVFIALFLLALLFQRFVPAT